MDGHTNDHSNELEKWRSKRCMGTAQGEWETSLRGRHASVQYVEMRMYREICMLPVVKHSSE